MNIHVSPSLKQFSGRPFTAHPKKGQIRVTKPMQGSSVNVYLHHLNSQRHKFEEAE